MMRIPYRPVLLCSALLTLLVLLVLSPISSATSVSDPPPGHRVEGLSNLYAAGSFGTFGGIATLDIARGDGNGWSPDFNMRGTRNGVLALAHDGEYLYVGGNMNMAAGVSVNRLVRWDGATFDGMGGGANMWVLDFALADAGALYASGYFTEIGGISANRVARWDGDHWSALGSGLDDQVDALAVLGETVFAGGWFKHAGGAASSYIATWRENPPSYPLYLSQIRR